MLSPLAQLGSHHKPPENFPPARSRRRPCLPPPSMLPLPHHVISISEDELEGLDSPTTPPVGLLKSRKNRIKSPDERHSPNHQPNQRQQPSHSKKKNEILVGALITILNNRQILLVILPLIGVFVFGAWNVFAAASGKLPNTNIRFEDRSKERCLKLLSPEELENLELPSKETSSFPVNGVVYRSEDDGYYDGDNKTLLQEELEHTRFNLFTGYQTLAQRKQSYKVNETALLHCGFYSENGGFEIYDKDRSYMQSCEVVVSTCAFGGGDDLHQPIGMSNASLRKVCYVAFWDEITLKTQEAEGQRMDNNHMIGKWRVIIVRELPFADQRLNGKIPKMLAHRLFPQARYSIWVDSKSQYQRDPLGVLEALLWRTNSVLAISEHGARSSIYDEGKAVVEKNKATPEEVELQLSQYYQDGFPDEKRLNGKKALAEASVIVREHTALTNQFMCLWFNEVVRFTSRDQLSFRFVLRQLHALKNVYLFPVCTRKKLVNSMGHKRKARFHIS